MRLLRIADIMKSEDKQKYIFLKEEITMTRKILCLVMAVLMFGGTFTVSANCSTEDLPIGYYNIVYANRYVFFASDGGTYIRPLELPRGTAVNLNEYVPTKNGYIFDGWYSDPRTKVERVNEIVLNENITVYAKWLDDGTSKQTEDTRIYATNKEIMQYGNHIDEKTGVSVTALWVQQNERLQALMKLYNEKFNK